MAGAAERLVLDTNACLDLFVFDDPLCGRLHEALRDGRVVAVTDDACRDEWLRVLSYPRLALDGVRREAAMRRYDAVLHRCPGRRAGDPAGTPPRCRDPDDQKFLDLAHRTGARWLLTRDDHLLALARRARRQGLFEILPPQHWTGALAHEAGSRR